MLKITPHKNDQDLENIQVSLDTDAGKSWAALVNFIECAEKGIDGNNNHPQDEEQSCSLDKSLIIRK